MNLYKEFYKDVKHPVKEVDVNRNNNSKWSAVVLDAESQTKLKSLFKTYIPVGWTVKCHHMTIDPFNEYTGKLYQLGDIVNLSITYVGVSNLASAVKVVGFKEKTNNSFPHVTLAVNEQIGGKAKDSNSIINWTPILQHVTLSGTVENV
jgi:hypothetical protein